MKTPRTDAYRFYELPECVQEAYIGDEYPTTESSVYIGVRWCERSMYMNYCRKNGLIFLTRIVSFTGKPYFNVGVFSPDDWDYGVSIDVKNEKLGLNLRHKIARWLKDYLRLDKDVSHEVLFKDLIEEFSLDKETCFI